MDVPLPILIDKSIKVNGTYNASSDNVDGYSRVNVDVPESKLQDTKTYTIEYIGNIESTDKTIVPTSGYDAMKQVDVKIMLYAMSGDIRDQAVNSTYFNYYWDAFLPSHFPTDDNSYTDKQDLITNNLISIKSNNHIFFIPIFFNKYICI